MADGFEELTRIIERTAPDGKVDRQVWIDRKEMTADEIERSMKERDALFRGMAKGGVLLLDGMEKLFGSLDPELKEAIDRARGMGRFR